jgi:hypothetical protein
MEAKLRCGWRSNRPKVLVIRTLELRYDLEMALRNEWTEWHLTPRGWEQGATRVQGKGNTWTAEPEDRALSFVYKEVEASTSTEVNKSLEETWRSKKTKHVEELLKQYGACPEKL